MAARLLFAITGLALLAEPGWAEVPSDLVEELGGVVEEALNSDEGEARAWALRARTLLGGRDLRTTLLDQRENTDLLVRVFAGVGLVELGRSEGVEILSNELQQAGQASRQRILQRYVRHLPEADQVSILEAVLSHSEDVGVIGDALDYIARHGRGAVFDLLGRVAEASDGARPLYLAALSETARPEVVAVARGLSTSADPASRRLSLEIAAAVRSDDSSALMESLLHDEDPGVAMAAALALAPRGMMAAYNRLVELIATGEVAQRVAALEAIRDAQALLDFDTLQGMLQEDTDPTLRRRIFEALGATSSEQALELLLQMVDSTVYEERLDGIAGLGYTRRDPAVEPLGEVLLGGGGLELRGLAAEALGNLHLAAAADPLIAALDRERGGEVKVAVIEALAHAPSESALWPLAFQLTNDDTQVVQAALRTLGALGATSVAAQVENAATSHRDPGVRWTATLVLFGLDPEVGAIRLNQALDRPPEGFMSDIDALPEGPRLDAYERLLRHSNPDNRLMASSRVLALEEAGLDIMRRQLESSAPSDMRQLAVSVLTANRNVADLEIFHDMSDTSHPVMRYQALEAIVELASPASEALLRGLLDSTDAVRRVMAVYGLWKIAAQP